MKRVTIQDIAKKLDISFSTVARALNDHPAISDATKKRVQEVARKLHYQPNKLASSLRSGKTHIIGVIVPSLEVSFFSSVVHGIDRVMNEKGYSILLYQSSESFDREVKGIETFLKTRVDGIIASIAQETTRYGHFEEVLKRHTPLILFDRIADTLRVPSVHIDDYQGGLMATRHLIAQGYRDIIHLTSAADLQIVHERLRGYRDALLEAGLPLREDYILKGPYTVEFGRSSVRDLLSAGIAFDAIFAWEDYTALGALQELQARGVRVPDEVGVIGFADESFDTLIRPSLTSIDQQTIRMGEAAATLFLGTLGPDGVPPESITLEPILRVRESTMRTRTPSA